MDPESSRTLSRKLPSCASTLGADPVTTPAILRDRGPSQDREFSTVRATLPLCDIRRKHLLMYVPASNSKSKQQLFSVYVPGLFYSPTLQAPQAPSAVLLPQSLLPERAPLSIGLRTRYSYPLSLIVLMLGRRKLGGGGLKNETSTLGRRESIYISLIPCYSQL